MLPNRKACLCLKRQYPAVRPGGLAIASLTNVVGALASGGNLLELSGTKTGDSNAETYDDKDLSPDGQTANAHTTTNLQHF